MIKRRYFYHFIKQDPVQPKFVSGIVTVTTWFPDPGQGWEFVLDQLCKDWDCDRTVTQCLAFNRL